MRRELTVVKLLHSATMSVDGYIAGAGGDMSWLRPYLGPNPVAEELRRDVGALLIGARTAFGDDPNRGTDHEGAFEGAWHGPAVVVTHRQLSATPDVTYLSEIDAAVDLARELAGDKAYVNILGADIARQLLARGLIDEILVIVAPVLLGAGVPLLSDAACEGVRLERMHHSVVPHGVNLWFRVERPPTG